MAKAHRLKIRRLDFLSAVDAGAQGPVSNAVLLKRATTGVLEMEGTFKVCKVSDSESLGLVFGYAFAASLDGGQTPHVDHQDDAIDPDFLKCAMEWVENGGATDVMHDQNADGRVIFAWPLLPEINAALGISSEVHGLAVAIKPSAETFKRFQSKELGAFSIGGVGDREPLEKRDCSTCKGGVLKTPFCPMCGTDMAAPDVPADATESDSVPVIIEDEPSSAKVTVNVIAARASKAASPTTNPRAVIPVIGKSTHAPASPHLGRMEEIKKLEAEKAELLKRSERLERISKLSGAHKTHFDTLTGDDADAFLAKSASDRASDIAKAIDADPVIYTTADGLALRKSVGDLAISMAKKLDAQALEIAKRDAEIEKSEVTAIAKSHLGNLGGDDDVHQLVVRCVRKSGADAALVTKALDAMKGWNTLAKEAQAPRGFGGETGPASTGMAAFVAKRDEFLKTEIAKGKPMTPEAATVAFMRTPEGARLYGETSTTQPSA